MLSLKLKTIDVPVGSTDVAFKDLEINDADTVKIMVWKSASKLEPLCNAYVVELR